MKYWLVRAAAAVTPRLPWWMVYPLARGAVRLLFELHVGARAAVEENMRIALGPGATHGEVTRAARRVFANAARYYIDLFRIPRMDPRILERDFVRETGYYEYLDAAVAAGKGVVVVSAHLGTPEAPIQAMSARGRTFLALVEPVEPPRLAEFVRELRQAHGHQFPTIGVETMKETLRWLRAGGAVVVLSDRDIQGNGRCVNVFGRPARLPAGAFEMALRTGAAIVPGFTRRVDDRHWSIDILPPIEVLRTAHRDDDVLAAMKAFVALLEDHIRRDPGQWVVLSRFWGGCEDGGGPAADSV